jgi:hypothetical protein
MVGGGEHITLGTRGRRRSQSRFIMRAKTRLVLGHNGKMPAS